MVREQVETTTRRHGMLVGGERVLLAVSGGVDSMTLLDVLVDLSVTWDLTLGVAHLDHRMRPESTDDARFVTSYVESLDLPLIQETIDVPAHIAREGCSPEAGARNVRYRFLREAAQAFDASGIALGHTRDDRVETLLINLLRGAGIQGLAGMPPTRQACNVRYIRPLIDCSRAEVEAYAKTRQLPYREDPSNRDPTYTRNRVRHELMPLLETFNPSVRDSLERANDALFELHDFLHLQADGLLERALREEFVAGAVWDAAVLQNAHPALERQALREAIVHVKSDIEGITADHIKALADLIHQGQSGRSVSLPDGLTARYQAGRLVIVAEAQDAPDVAPISVPLAREGTTVVPELGWRFIADEIPGSHPESTDRLEARLDAGTMVGPLSVRNRRPGDRIRPLGLGGTKKLQDIFVDAKVPRHHRDTGPLVCDEQGILWVTGLCLSERAQVTPDTQTTLCIRAERLSSGEAR